MEMVDRFSWSEHSTRHRNSDCSTVVTDIIFKTTRSDIYSVLLDVFARCYAKQLF